MIMGETAKKSEARSPAVVPPIVLTSAKITIVVSEPIITGNIIVKSYRLDPMPIWYSVAPEACNITCEVFEISLPCGYQLKSSFHSKYAGKPFSTINSVAR